MKISVNWVTFLLFIYNVILGYVIAQSAEGTNKIILLFFISVDYIIIFYLVSTILKTTRRRKARR